MNVNIFGKETRDAIELQQTLPTVSIIDYQQLNE